jgi:hypothetical protein
MSLKSRKATLYFITKASFRKAFLAICRRCKHNYRRYRCIPLHL